MQTLGLFLLCVASCAVQAQSVAQDRPATGATEQADLPTQERAAPLTQLRDGNDLSFYRNRFEFSVETGGLPINIPFAFDVFTGGDYSQKPLHYTLVPIFPSLRWQMSNVRGPGILRGNSEVTASFSVTAIPRGPEKVYRAFDLGVRRNFVPRRGKLAPFVDFKLGAGFIDAQGPHGVQYAQGEDYTFTLWLGAGLRYNINPRYSVSVGPAYMHVSNAFLSEPRYEDTGINVCGGMIGLYMRLGKPKHLRAR